MRRERAAEVRAAARGAWSPVPSPGRSAAPSSRSRSPRPSSASATTTPRSCRGSGGWCPTTSTSSCPSPTSTGSRRTTRRCNKELTLQLQEHAEKQSYVFAGPVTIALRDAPTTSPSAASGCAARPHAAVISNATHTQVRRARAFLEVNGTRHPLQPPGLVVGRGTEADLRINDPGVSRRHVEFTVDESVTGGVSDLRAGPRLHQRHARRRPPHHQHARSQDGSEVRIGRTDDDGARRGGRRCLS